MTIIFSISYGVNHSESWINTLCAGAEQLRIEQFSAHAISENLRDLLLEIDRIPLQSPI